MMTPRQAIGELTAAGLIWGFGFVATIWALQGLSPSQVLAWRFIFAFALAEGGLLLWYLLSGQRQHMRVNRSDFFLALPAGLLLAAMLLPQTIGLQYTTASKSGFLTTLYVIFVPLLSQFILRRRQRRALNVYSYALIALIGALFLMGFDGTPLNPGDLWTILCALMASIHILYVDHIVRRVNDPFRFNNYQTLFCLVALLPMLLWDLLTQQTVNTTNPLTWVGVLCLALGSTVIGFTIQLRTQKVLSTTTASMLFLLESPFALIFGVWFLNESFGLRQAFGALLILIAAVLTIHLETQSSTLDRPLNSKT